MADDLTVGTRIYRPARLAAVGAGSQVLMESPSMQDFGDGTVMLRAVFDAAWAPTGGWRPGKSRAAGSASVMNPSRRTGPTSRSCSPTSTSWRSRRWPATRRSCGESPKPVEGRGSRTRLGHQKFLDAAGDHSLFPGSPKILKCGIREIIKTGRGCSWPVSTFGGRRL